MKVDDSFKKPGAIPFKWEIRPGVPKNQSPQPRVDDPKIHVRPESPKLQHSKQLSPRKRVTSSPKLKPPPSGLSCSNPTIILNPKGNNSIKASPRTRSLRMMNLMRPDVVSSSSCFPSPSSVKRIGERTKKINNNEYYSDSDDVDHHHQQQQQRWSVSSRKSAVSASPLSSSFASYLSSPRIVNNDDVDDEWVNAVLMHF